MISSNYFGLNLGLLYNLRYIEIKPEFILPLGRDVSLNTYLKLGIVFRSLGK